MMDKITVQHDSAKFQDSKISQIWLKMPIQAFKIMFWGREFWPPQIIFYHRDPQKALPYAYAKARVLRNKWSWSVF